jgi:hypothetical protein
VWVCCCVGLGGFNDGSAGVRVWAGISDYVVAVVMAWAEWGCAIMYSALLHKC